MGLTGGAGCSPVGEKCPFGHKKGYVCSPEAAALHLGLTGGAGCSLELAELQAGYILGCIGVFSRWAEPQTILSAVLGKRKNAPV